MKKIFNKMELLLKTGFIDIFGSSVINKVITFLSNIILVHILSKTEFGRFTYAWNIYNIICLFRGLALDSGFLQLSSERSNDINFLMHLRGYVYRVGTLINLVLALIITLIGFTVHFKINNVRTLIVATCFLPLLQFLFGIVSCELRAKKLNKQFAKLSNFNTVLHTLGIIIGALLFREIGMIFSMYAINIISVIYGETLLGNKEFSCGNLEKNDIKDLFSISFVSLCATGLSQMLYILDIFTIGIVTSNENILASYKVATQIPTALTFIPLSVITYIYPYFAEHRMNGVWCLKKYKQILVLFGSFNLSVSISLFILAPFIINTLYGNDYADSLPIFRLLSINYFISSTFRILSGNLLVTQRKLNFNLLIAIITGIINLLGNLIFIPKFKSIGAAVVTMLVVLMSGIMSTFMLILSFKERINAKY